VDNLVDGVENGKSPLLSDKPDFSNEFLFEKACMVPVKIPRVLLPERIVPCRAALPHDLKQKSFSRICKITLAC